jgi:hypothetical protein
MTEAQKLVEIYRTEVTAQGSTTNPWKWARRVTAPLAPLGKSTIGYFNSDRIASIQVFRCADGSEFAYDMNGAKGVWAMPGEWKAA